MAVRFEEGTYTETKTGHRAIYVCDSCGKEVSGEVLPPNQSIVDNPIRDWFTIGTPLLWLDPDHETLLCSRQCVKEWALQPEAVPA